MGDGNDLPFYLNVNFASGYDSSSDLIVSNLNNVVSLPKPFNQRSISYYFSRGFIGNTYIEITLPSTASAYIMNNPSSTVVNFVYP